MVAWLTKHPPRMFILSEQSESKDLSSFPIRQSVLPTRVIPSQSTDRSSPNGPRCNPSNDSRPFPTFLLPYLPTSCIVDTSSGMSIRITVPSPVRLCISK